MLTVFRKIRHSLLENKSSRYLLYALGEIILVVAGILIALQINNWNEGKKNDRREIQFLKGIQNDLQKDSARINRLFNSYASHLGLIEWIVTGYSTDYIRAMAGPGQDSLAERLNETILSNVPKNDVKIHIKSYCRRKPSFRPTIGTFNALIADGNTQIIKNRSLFNAMQYLYLVESENMNSVYETTKTSEDYLNRRHSRLIQNNIYWSPGDFIDDDFKADLLYAKDPIALYFILLARFQISIHSILGQIKDELQKA